MKHTINKSTKTLLTGVKNEDIQPNACDLRLAKVLQLGSSTFVLSEDEKVHRGSVEIKPDADGWLYLVPGAYEIVFENKINVGDNEAGFVMTRSTLNRNGVFITTGLYDSGYAGPMSATLHVTTGVFKVKPGTRLAQYICFEADMVKLYNGSYGVDQTGNLKPGQEHLSA